MRRIKLATLLTLHYRTATRLVAIRSTLNYTTPQNNTSNATAHTY